MDDKEFLKLIYEELKDLRKANDECHKELRERISIIENNLAYNRGRITILGAIGGGLVTLAVYIIRDLFIGGGK